MSNVFISYSREDGDFVRDLSGEIETLGYKVWVDLEEIAPTQEWLETVFSAIEAADNFVFVIAPDSVVSKYCEFELKHAEKHNKKIITILARPTPDQDIPSNIGKIQRIDFTDAASQDESLKQLSVALERDEAYVMAHTRCLVRARHWADNARHSSLTLRGRDLREAVQWLEAKRESEPSPTTLQREFIAASQRSESRRRWITLGAATAAAVALVVIGLNAARERETARQQHLLLAAGNNIEEARGLATERPVSALVKAVEAARLLRSVDGARQPAIEQGLRELLAAVPAVDSMIGSLGDYQRITRCGTGGLFAVAQGGMDVSVRLWDMESASALPIDLQGRHANDPGTPEPLNTYIKGLACSADGRTVAATTGDGAWLWTHQDESVQLVNLPETVDGWFGLVLSDHGRRLAVVDRTNRAVGILDTANLAADPNRIAPFTERVFLQSMSPDGQWLATTNGSGDPFLLNIDSRERFPLFGPRIPAANKTSSIAPTSAFAFSGDSSWLAIGGEAGETLLWNLSVLPPITPLVLRGLSTEVHTVAIDSSGRRLAAADSHQAMVWRLDEPEAPPLQLPGKQGRFGVMTFSADGEILHAAGNHGIQRWDLGRKLEPLVLLDQGDPLTAVALSTSGRWLVTGSESAEARVWDLDNRGHQPRVLAGHERGVDAVGISHDGRRVATLDGAENGRLWSLASKAGGSLPTTEIQLHRLASSPDGRWFAGVLPRPGGAGTVVLWDLDEPEPSRTILPESDFTTRVVFSPDSRWVVGPSGEGTVLGWDLRAPAEPPVETQNPEKPIAALDVGFDGIVATLSYSGSILVRSLLEPARVPAEFGTNDEEISGKVLAIALQPGGRWIATTHRRYKPWLWDTQAPATAPTIILATHEESPTGIEFSPDGRWLASVSQDGNARLWDMRQPQSDPVVLRGHTAAIADFAFSSDSRFLVTAGNDGTARVWRVNFDELVEMACLVIDGRPLDQGIRGLWDIPLPADGGPVMDDNVPSCKMLLANLTAD